MQQVISGAEVVLATNTGAGDALLAQHEFDLAVIDEAAQALECSAWIPMLKARRVVLAGDHKQLPPTVRSRDAERAGLGVTLFERAQNELGADFSRLLSVQYRMHEKIMRWSSDTFYDGRVEAAATVRTHRLADVPYIEENELTASSLVLWDTAGCDHDEEEDGASRVNAGEVNVVSAHIARLIEAGVPERDIAVISPYRAQVKRLRAALDETAPEVEIGTVDGFQGREKEAVLISMARSNRRGEVGFLAEPRRMNVAVTRARRQACLIGDSATVTQDPFLSKLFEYFEANGLYRSAFEL